MTDKMSNGDAIAGLKHILENDLPSEGFSLERHGLITGIAAIEALSGDAGKDVIFYGFLHVANNRLFDMSEWADTPENRQLLASGEVIRLYEDRPTESGA